MTTLAQMTSDIELYTSYDDPDFVAMIPLFIKESEERIWMFVQLPFFRRSQTGNLTIGNTYLQLPADFLAPSSLAIIDPVTGAYTYLLNKDIEYIREVYPTPTATGVPYCYALFDADDSSTTITVGPSPDLAYAVQLNYFYKLVDVPTGTWLSEHAYDTLLYGALAESATYLKRNAGIDNMGDTYDQRFLTGLQGLKNLGESRDRKDTYRSGEKRKAEVA